MTPAARIAAESRAALAAAESRLIAARSARYAAAVEYRAAYAVAVTVRAAYAATDPLAKNNLPRTANG